MRRGAAVKGGLHSSTQCSPKRQAAVALAAAVIIVSCWKIFATQPLMVALKEDAVDTERQWAMAQLGAPFVEQFDERALTQMIRGAGGEYSSSHAAHRIGGCNVSTLHASYRHKNASERTTIRIEYVRVSPAAPRRGVMLVFHGCGHTSLDFCEPSLHCPKCRGLPEEVKFVSAAASHGLEVLAVSSPNAGSRCWGASRAVRPDPQLMWNNKDVYAVLFVLQREGVLGTHVPIVAMGASSGGAVLAVLPQVLGGQLYAAIAQISAPQFSSGRRPRVVLYDVMANDPALRARAVKEQALLAKAPDVQHTAVRVFTPPSLTPDIFSQRIPGFPLSASADLVTVLSTEAHMVVGSSLKVNPRTSRKKWVPHVRRALSKHTGATEREQWLLSDDLVADASPIAEELNVLFGVHEFFADHVDEHLRDITAR